MLFCNFASNTGIFSSTNVADISYKYNTLFAPAGYAFIIWGVIFILLLAFVIFQWSLVSRNDPKNIITRTGPWFTLSNLANAFWLYCWINEMLGLSVIVIIFLLVCLTIITVRLRMELDDEPLQTIFFVWWPIAVYLGWIMVATIACIAAWLVSIGRNDLIFGQIYWTIILIITAALLYYYLVKTRNLREAAVVGIWAFIAIAVRQWRSNLSISITAIVAALFLLIIIIIHGYKNRHYSIIQKLKRNEWKQT